MKHELVYSKTAMFLFPASCFTTSVGGLGVTFDWSLFCRIECYGVCSFRSAGVIISMSVHTGNSLNQELSDHINIGHW